MEEYLKKIGLGDLIAHVDDVKLNNIVEEVFALKFPALSEEEVKKLYVYDVPKMSADGSCSITSEKAEKPYNLAETFGVEEIASPLARNDKREVRGDKFDWLSLRNHPQTIRLWRLRQIVSKIYKQSEVEWFGIYRKIKNIKHETILVKESYEGLFSRAEFPLTKEFAKKSNNSTIGLSGRAIVIQDVAAHTGAYYKCDGKVNSEFCVPILKFDKEIASPLTRNDKVEVIGIIDAEAFAANHYSTERLLQIAKVAYDLGQKSLGI